MTMKDMSLIFKFCSHWPPAVFALTYFAAFRLGRFVRMQAL